MTLLASMGELVIDFIPVPGPGGSTAFQMCAGGSPFNVALGMARLGAPTAFVSKASTDYFGRFLRGHLAQEGVDLRFLASDEAFSTLAFVAYDDGEPSYSFYGDDTADTHLRPADLPDALFDELSIAHVGSISLLRGETPATIVQAVERLKGRALISFDPNIRAGLIKDRPAYDALLTRVFKLADVVKISAADLAWLMPGVPLESAARALQAHGAGLVVVTRGGAGALALRGSDLIITPQFPVNVVDTVGAGDAFSGGLLAELGRLCVVNRAALDGLPLAALQDALHFAAVTAALTCATAGANPPTRAAVEHALAGAPARK